MRGMREGGVGRREERRGKRGGGETAEKKLSKVNVVGDCGGMRGLP